tara:strand:+ start:198 stop:557 length:360 start_codon:yes stop_codon:yes gene_type:complete
MEGVITTNKTNIPLSNQPPGGVILAMGVNAQNEWKKRVGQGMLKQGKYQQGSVVRAGAHNEWKDRGKRTTMPGNPFQIMNDDERSAIKEWITEFKRNPRDFTMKEFQEEKKKRKGTDSE